MLGTTPGIELTCATCHFGGPTSLLSVSAPSTYAPGQAVTVEVSGVLGFEVTVRDQNENFVGTLQAGSGSRVAGTRTGYDPSQYLTHVAPGGPWSFRWVPPSAAVGPVTFHVTGVGSRTAAGSTSGRTDLKTVTLTAATPPVAPVARPDAASIDEDQQVDVPVLANDTANGPSLTVTSVGRPVNGAAVVLTTGIIRYQPNLNFNGTDRFTYTISNGSLTAGSEVTVTVRPVNDAPTAPALTAPSGSVAVEGNPAATVAVTWTGATDVDGDALTYRLEGHLGGGYGSPISLSVTTTGTSSGWRVSALADLLDRAGVAAGGSATLRFRVVATDGTLETASLERTVGLFRGVLVATEGNERPLAFALQQPAPNPSSGPKVLAFDMPEAALVQVDVFDALGRRVWSRSAPLPSGRGRRVEVGRLPAGSYLVRAVAGVAGQPQQIGGRFVVVE